MAKQDVQTAFLRALRTGAPTPPARRGKGPRQIRLDRDILAFFEGGEQDATTRIEEVLRAYIAAERDG